MTDKPKALDFANPLAPEHLWEPSIGGLSGRVFVMGYAYLFDVGDYIFFRGSSPQSRAMYRITEKSNTGNENHQWRATLQYVSTPPSKYDLWPKAGGMVLSE